MASTPRPRQKLTLAEFLDKYVPDAVLPTIDRKALVQKHSHHQSVMGFDADEAQLIASQTARGAASLLLENRSHPETEIDKVTTPEGCTIAGLNEMEHQGFSSSLIKGVVTSYNKIVNDM